jgi:hypothetical protein
MGRRARNPSPERRKTMATNSNATTKSPKKPPTARTNDPATDADAALAATLISATGKPIGKPLSSTAVAALSNEALQRKILSIAPLLVPFAGCEDVQGILDNANEAEDLAGVYDRLINSAGRVRQRCVQLGKRVLLGQTDLLRAKKASSPTGPIAKALAGLAGLRKSEVTKTKGAKTKNRKRRAAAKAGAVSKA